MRVLLAAVCAALIPAALGQVEVQVYTVDTFRAELDRLSASLDSETPEAVAQALPPSWDVQTPSKRYAISTSPLRGLLDPPPDEEAPDEERPKPARRVEMAREYLTALRESAAGAAVLRSGNPARERSTLEDVLRREEFRGVGAPNRWAQFRDRMLGWISRMIDNLLRLVLAHPTSSRILFWCVLVGAVLFLAWWVYRLWARGEALGPLLTKAVHEQPEARSWQAWLRDAQQAATAGDAREAIRCAYWAGVARLQEDRLLPARLSKTPRECLRLVAGVQREPLRGLTTALERFWYAGQGAAAADVAESFRHLETLGCKAD